MRRSIPPEREDQVFLEGPRSRKSELGFIFRIAIDFFRGIRNLHFVGPCVTVFGSARFGEDHPYYDLGRRMGASLAGIGFTVMTGGGPGIMEAANRGAREAGGRSVGCNVVLPMEQKPNPYLDHWVTLHYFFIRKVFLFKYSFAFVALPGGAGTMDELFEAVTLIQTKKISSFPVVLMGKEYWRPLMTFLDDMVEEGTISASDLDLFLVTDSVEEAIAHIDQHAVKKYQLRSVRIPIIKRILSEK